MTAADYDPPAPPAFERAGFLVIRSLAECGACEARSPWWFGDMPAAWPAEHLREQHPQTARVGFRIWRIVRYYAHLEPGRGLARIPPAVRTPEPPAFALSECRACGENSHWIEAEGEKGALAHWERGHQRATHPKTPAQFDRWHLTRTAAADCGPNATDHEQGTRT